VLEDEGVITSVKDARSLMDDPERLLIKYMRYNRVEEWKGAIARTKLKFFNTNL
jgi:hypothetical protein